MKRYVRSILQAAAVLFLSEAASAQSVVDPALQTLVERFVQAQVSFDDKTLTDLTAPSYVEVSPVGDIDSREKMLGFYAPAKKNSGPSVKVSEIEAHPFAHSAIIIAKLTYIIAEPDGAAHDIAMRAVYVASDTGAGWKLLSSQYTGIRPAKQ